MSRWRPIRSASRHGTSRHMHTIASSPSRSRSRVQTISATVERWRRVSERLASTVPPVKCSLTLSVIAMQVQATARRANGRTRLACLTLESGHYSPVRVVCIADVLHNWVRNVNGSTKETVDAVPIASISLTTPLVRTGANVKWIGTTDPTTPIDHSSNCAPGQRLAGVGADAVCADCPAATYEVDGRCQACVSATAQTPLTRPVDSAGTPILCLVPVACTQPDGVICGQGTHLGTWALVPGRWRISPTSTDIRRCERKVSNDQSSRCAGGTMDAQGSADALCTEGHFGPMCMLCVTNQSRAYFDRSELRCKDCPNDAWTRICLAVGVLIGTIVLVYVLQYSWRQSRFNGG
jgi:hypothetical protein